MAVNTLFLTIRQTPAPPTAEEITPSSRPGHSISARSAGGRVLLTGIGRLATYRGGIYWALWHLFDLFASPEARRTGRVPGYDHWYTFAQGELDALAEDAGLSVEDRVGCEGLATYLPMDRLEQVEKHPDRWPVWKEILLETCNEPSIVGLSNHQLVVARKAI